MDKVIVANYRYFISGGPEVYMFKFINNAESIGYDAIPFSVNYSCNEETKYKQYFINSRGENTVYYNDLKKKIINLKVIYRTIQGAFFNKQAYRNITNLINDEHPKVLYALQVMNTLSPSIFKAAKKKGLKVVFRISDFDLICPRVDMLLNDNPCELCIKKGLNQAVKHKCFHSSIMATLIRVLSMKYHRMIKIYDYVDYFVTPTKFTRQKLIDAGFDANKIVHIPTFIDSNLYIPNYDHEKYFLFLGRVSHEKGLIYAIKALINVDINYKLYITGNYDEMEDEIKNIIIENNLINRLVFAGFVKGEELKKLISNCISVLCPAIWYENMPNVLLESYAYGKPVIASNIGSFAEIVENNVTGLLFEPKNSFELADKMNYLINNPEITKSMGLLARRKVEEKYNIKNHFEKLKDLFND